jgi:hypothetical protein
MAKKRKDRSAAKEAAKELEAGPSLLDRISRYPLAIVVTVGVLICLPLILYGLPTTSDDAVWHVIYFDNFAVQFLSGEIYPRWMYLMNGGLGSPTFFFYQPMSYFIALIFRPLPISSIHQLGLASSLGVIFSGIAAFYWLREISGVRAAIVGSLFYLILPYPVAQDVYVRAAFGEAFTFVWMPLALLAAVRIIRGSNMAVAGLAFSYGMLCMTHLPITVIFSPVLVLYLVVFAEKGTFARTLIKAFAGIILGAGMAAAYIIPAVAYQYYVYLNEMREGSLYFGNWLMTTNLAIYDSMRYFQLTAVAVIAASVCALVGSMDADGSQRRKLIFWSIIVTACVFMTLKISAPIWSSIIMLQALQFPWRFNSLASLAVAAIITVSLSTIGIHRSTKSKVLAAFLLLFGGYCLIDLIVVVRESQTKPREAWKQSYDKTLYRLQEETHGRWPKAVSPSVGDLDEAMKPLPASNGSLDKAFFEGRQGTFDVVRWKPRDIEIKAENTAPDKLVISQMSFPGWTARDLDSGVAMPTELTGDLGLVSVKLPAGKHRIEFTLEKMWPEIIGDVISLISLAMGLVLLLVIRKFSNSTATSPPNAVAEHA